MKHTDPKELEKEKHALTKAIRLLVWAGLPLFAFIWWLVAFLADRYVGESFSFMEAAPVMLAIWLVTVGDKVLRIRQINKALSVLKQS